MNHLSFGASGELLARQFLLNKGHDLVCNNYRFGRTEIDLITCVEDTLVFTEVKTRTSVYFGSPADAVSKHKQRQIIKTAEAFIHEHNRKEEVRFDVIGIVWNRSQCHIQHLEHAFYPLGYR